VICFGARRGKQPTFVLLDEWVPASKPRPREEALGELARRYFAGHGPATVADLAWWSGLTLKDAKEAMLLAQPGDDREQAAKGTVHLLPPFDEYTVAYRDRGAIVDPAFAKRVNAGGGIINAVVVVNGIVTGSWKRTLRGANVEISSSPFRALTPREAGALGQEAQRYARFVGKTLRA
jgi:hypothetical protein